MERTWQALLWQAMASAPARRIDRFPTTSEHAVLEAGPSRNVYRATATAADRRWALALITRCTRPGVLGELLATLPAGPELQMLLDTVTLTQADDFSLVEVVAGHKRMESHFAARSAAAAAALADRAALLPIRWENARRRSQVGCPAGEELAMRLGLARRAARRLVLNGSLFNRTLEATGQALARGEIDYAKADVIAMALENVSVDVALAAENLVLPRAPGHTRAQVAQDVAAAVIAVDPESADTRHRQARDQRRICRPRVLPDGMASIYGVLPAADAIAMDLALDAAARAAKNTGDPRTVDQLRADAFALLGHTALATGHIGPDCSDHDNSSAATRVCLERSAGGDREPSGSSPDSPPCDCSPSDGPSYDSLPNDALSCDHRFVESPSHDGTSLNSPPSDHRTVRPHVGHGAGPRPSRRGPVRPPPGVPDRRQPGRVTSAHCEASPRSAADPPASCPSPVPPAPEATLPGGRLPRVKLGMIGGNRVAIRLTVPLGVALPASTDDEQPWAVDREPQEVAQLEGYGAIPPVVARAMTLGGTWQRLVTDSLTGTVLDVGRRRYRPPAELARFVRERDRTCVRPGCSVPARSCELDHTDAWSAEGATAAENLGALCTRDHALKSTGSFTVRRQPDGSFDWTTPTGHAYRRQVDGTVRILAPGVRASMVTDVDTQVRRDRATDPWYLLPRDTGLGSPPICGDEPPF